MVTDGRMVTMGLAADALTFGRAVLAAPVGITAWAGNWTATALLLAVAWWSDLLDGIASRHAGGVTRLGGWDLGADTLVGAGVLTGLIVGRHAPTVWGVVGAVLGVGFVLLRNPALGMLLQALAYGLALFLILRHSPVGFGLAGVTIVAIAILGRSRLFGFVLPAFFSGVIGRRWR